MESPAEVPVHFAVAVHRIIHDIASPDDWEMLDTYSREQALQWIEQILEANQWQFDRNLSWWACELTKPDN
jgi:hypothetical protein